MSFTDLIFVFAFLPVYLIAGYCCRETWAKNAVSVLAALLFIIWGRPWYLSLIILPVILIYIPSFFPERPRRLFTKLFAAVGCISGLAAAAFVGSEGTLKGSLLSIGFCVFSMKCISFASEKEPKKDFFAVAAWFLSPENLLVCPIESFSETRGISSRKITLSKMSAGAAMFIKGFAKAAVCGLVFERLRLAALSGEAFPWLNALMSVGASVAGAYVTVAGTLEMSRGIALMNGLSPKLSPSWFTPSFRLSKHADGLWDGLSGFTANCFCGSFPKTVLSLAAVSLAVGVLFSFGAGSAAAFGIVVAALIIEGSYSQESRPSDLAVSLAAWLFAALLQGWQSPQGAMEFFAALDYNKYGYDITYALNAEFWRGLLWLAVGLALLTPLPSLAGGAIRRKMRESDGFYTAARVAETLLCAGLLVLGAIAATA